MPSLNQNISHVYSLRRNKDGIRIQRFYPSQLRGNIGIGGLESLCRHNVNAAFRERVPNDLVAASGKNIRVIEYRRHLLVAERLPRLLDAAGHVPIYGETRAKEKVPHLTDTSCGRSRTECHNTVFLRDGKGRHGLT